MITNTQLTQEETHPSQGYGAIIKEASQVAFGDHGSTAHTLWMINSGIAHGRTWARIALFEQQHLVPTRDGFVNLRMSSSQTKILQHAQVAAEMIKLGWNLVDQRRTCHLC
jgi:hypothetical protein